MRRWRRLESSAIHRCEIFDLHRVSFEPTDAADPRDFYVIEAPDWINVIPVTDDRRVLMVRQYRFGIEDVTLEIPGGMCEPNEPVVESARRELREETGHDAAEMIELGWVHPNPPIQNNRCHTFLARGLTRTGEPAPDENESFEHVSVPLDDVSRLIASGEITHALVLAAFQLLTTSGVRI